MKVDEQLKCKDCDWYRSCEYYHKRKETSQICKMFNNTWNFIAELEKIKDRLEIAMWYNHRDKEYCLELIGKRISELEGENNGKRQRAKDT